MDAIECLHTRNSTPKLVSPAPDHKHREIIFQAALRAPDHARLRPWRFLTIEGDGRGRLGELFVSAALAEDPSCDQQAQSKLYNNPLRAPLLVVVIASTQEHPKVPRQEQLSSTAAAAQSILLATHALGFGAMWRTGPMAYNPTVKRGLGLANNEEIVGFLYMGSVDGRYKPLPSMASQTFVSEWPEG